jgi:cobalt ECF transporter T component CbiQ
MRRPSPETPPPPARGRMRGDFAERTLAALAESLRETHVAETWARRQGLLQGLDARAKVLGLIGLVVLLSWLHHPASLGVLLALALVLATASRVPLAAFLARVWLSVPLVVAAATLPAALNLVTPGPPLLVLWPEPLVALTLPGLAVAARLAARVGLAVTFVSLLALTTPWNELLRGLRVLGVPQGFVAVLLMTQRYLAVVLRVTSELLVARRSRVGGGALGASQRFVGGALGALFGKTRALTEEVHAAMLARGFAGEPAAARPARLGPAEGLFVAALGLAGALALAVGARG